MKHNTEYRLPLTPDKVAQSPEFTAWLERERSHGRHTTSDLKTQVRGFQHSWDGFCYAERL